MPGALGSKMFLSGDAKGKEVLSEPHPTPTALRVASAGEIGALHLVQLQARFLSFQRHLFL